MVIQDGKLSLNTYVAVKIVVYWNDQMRKMRRASLRVSSAACWLSSILFLFSCTDLLKLKLPIRVISLTDGLNMLNWLKASDTGPLGPIVRPIKLR